MKLKQYEVREFKSVWHSGPIELAGDVTCLVGKNEAGKTALLTALYRTNPIIPGDDVLDVTYDYPKREVEDYRFDVERGKRQEAVVVECQYELEDDDLTQVANAFGPGVLPDSTFTRKTYYGENNNKFCLSVDEPPARKHLADNDAFPDPLKKGLSDASDWSAFSEALDGAEATEAVTALKAVVAKVLENGLSDYIFNTLIWPNAPKFLYFDEYYQMGGVRQSQCPY